MILKKWVERLLEIILAISIVLFASTENLAIMIGLMVLITINSYIILNYTNITKDDEK
jgi:hypothetical protein